MNKVIGKIIERENKGLKVKYVVAGVVVTAGTVLAIKAYKRYKKSLSDPEVVMPRLDAMYKQLMDDVQSYIEDVKEGDLYPEQEEEIIKYIEVMAAKFNRCLIRVGDKVVEATDKYELLPTKINEIEEYFYRTLGGTTNDKK